MSNAQRFVWNLFVAFLPVAVLGLLLNKYIKAVLFNPYGVAAASIIGALVIFWVERPSMLADRAVNARVRDVDDMTALDAIKVGLRTMLRADPGHVALGVDADRRHAVRFVAQRRHRVLVFPRRTDTCSGQRLFAVEGTGAAVDRRHPGVRSRHGGLFIVALVVIRWLIRFVATHSLRVFAWYRLAFGALIPAAGASAGSAGRRLTTEASRQQWTPQTNRRTHTAIVSTAPRLNLTNPTSAAIAISAANQSTLPPHP